jgi:hypothetical protein
MQNPPSKCAALRFKCKPQQASWASFNQAERQFRYPSHRILELINAAKCVREESAVKWEKTAQQLKSFWISSMVWRF